MTSPALLEFSSDPGDPRFPPGTVNGRLLEAIMRHRHFVLRVENAVILDLLGPLREAQKEILADLAALAAREGALSDFQRMRRLRLMELERRIDAALGFVLRETLSRSLSDFRRFAEREWEIQSRLLRREIPDGIALDLIGPPADRIEAVIQSPLGGKRWQLRMQENYGLMSQRMKQHLAASVTLGEGMSQAASRLSQTFTQLGRNRLILTVRSEIQRIASATAVANYRNNLGVVKAVKVVETLDDRTCLICAAKDGQVLELTSTDLPPYHAACRGFPAPVTRSLTEMGLSDRDFPPSTRASMDGQVPDTVDYPRWFNQQSDAFQRRVLGPARYREFKAGLPITQMVRGLEILRIDDLPSMSVN